MLTLSPKAKMFVEEALADPRAAWLQSEVASLGLDPWSKPLSPYAIRVAIDALTETEQHIRDRLGRPKIDIDAQAELINDLGFIGAVQSDLQKELKRPH